MPTTDRIIEIAETSAFLSLENHLLKIRLPAGPPVTVPVKEVQCLILANPALTVTGCLLAALAAEGCMVLVSGPDRLPAAMQLPLEGNYVQTQRFLAQVNAPKPLSKRLWQIIVREKILNQARLLADLHGNDAGLSALAKKVRSGDPDNLEGRAAALYWKNLFGSPFQRDRDVPDSNLLLNYGYAVLRAMAARACCAAGLHPTIGLHHHNQYDPFCLADDLMEPFRPVVDRIVFGLNRRNNTVDELGKEHRRMLIQGLLDTRLPSSKGRCLLPDLLHMYAGQVVRSFLDGDVRLSFQAS